MADFPCPGAGCERRTAVEPTWIEWEGRLVGPTCDRCAGRWVDDLDDDQRALLATDPFLPDTALQQLYARRSAEVNRALSARGRRHLPSALAALLTVTDDEPSVALVPYWARFRTEPAPAAVPVAAAVVPAAAAVATTSRRHLPNWLFAVGSAICVVLGLFFFLRDSGDDDASGASTDPSSVTTTTAEVLLPTVVAGGAASGATSVPTVVATTAAPTTAAPTTTIPTIEYVRGSAPLRWAEFSGGTVYLRGRVPNQEIADQITAIAADVVGRENVVVEYEVDPTAPLIQGAPLYVRDSILFDANSSDPKPASFGVLDLGVVLMQQNPQMTVEIGGHSDGDGDANANLELSRQRAAAVYDYLVGAGVDASRLSVEAYGDTQPVADNATPEGRALNRRIELSIFDLLS